MSFLGAIGEKPILNFLPNINLCVTFADFHISDLFIQQQLCLNKCRKNDRNQKKRTIDRIRVYSIFSLRCYSHLKSGFMNRGIDMLISLVPSNQDQVYRFYDRENFQMLIYKSTDMSILLETFNNTSIQRYNLAFVQNQKSLPDT